MNWEAIGASAEALGVLAILVSLVYVAMQIRQNSQLIASTIEASRLAAFERNIESGNRIRELLILNPDLTELFIRARQSYKALNAAEKFRYGLLMRNMLSAVQGAYVRQQSVQHDPHEFEGLERVVDSLLEGRGGREWLESADPDWRPEFRDFVADRAAVCARNSATATANPPE